MGELGGVVAHAADAGHDEHDRGTQGRQADRIVPSYSIQALQGVSHRRRRLLRQRCKARVEVACRAALHRADLVLHIGGVGRRSGLPGQFRLCPGQHLRLGRPQFGKHRDLRRHHVGRVRLHLDPSGGAVQQAGRPVRHVSQRQRQPGRAQQRVAAQSHRCRPGMRGLPEEGDALLRCPPVTGEHAEMPPRVVQHPPAFDMKLDIGRRPGQRVGAGIADGPQRRAEAGAVAVGACQRPVQPDIPGIDAAAQEAWLEPRALLPRPVDDGQVAAGTQGAGPHLVQYVVHRGACGHDAQRAVEPPALRLAVEVGAGHDHGGTRPCQVQHACHVADGIDADLHAQVLHPAAQEIACGTVGLCGGHPVHPAGRGGADGRHGRQHLLQAAWISHAAPGRPMP